MGEIKKPRPEKFMCGFIYKEEEVLKESKNILIQKYGPIDYESPVIPFKHTDYYNVEMGKGLCRAFMSFERLICPSELAGIKIFTNETEKKFYYPGTEKRKINIDPGIMSLPKLILASTKNFYHRIYIGRGIYAEVTLKYRGGNFETFEWTFPDYASDEYKEILLKIRGIYASQVKKEELK